MSKLTVRIGDIMKSVDKKLNILIVHNYYQRPGGEDTVVANEKELLLQNNHNVYEYTRSNCDICEKGILNKIKLGLTSIFSIKTYGEVKKIILEKKIDIIHVHNTFVLVSPAVYYAGLKLKKPIVQTLHNFRFICPKGILFRNGSICMKCKEHNYLEAIKYGCYRQSKLQTLLIVLIFKIHRIIGIYDKIDAYITLTKFDKEILETTIDKNKIYVKPNFVFRDKGVCKKEDFFVFIGRLDEAKGINILIENWTRVENSKLYVFGDGPLKVELLDYIEQHKIRGVVFMGHRNYKYIRNYLSRAKALIVPSQCYESFGMVIIEAFSLCTPVIGKNIGSISTIIEDNFNGLLFDKNEELSDKIELINEDDQLLEKLISGAEESAEKYMPEENYNILMNIYDRVLKRM